MNKLKFEELALSSEMLKAIEYLGFEETSPIQSEAIPLMLQGLDITGHAQTGTGKTAAFAIPIIEKLDSEQKEIQAIILCPTRELVIQVTDEFRKLMKYFEHFSIVPIYGGQEIERQFKALKKNPQIIVGTPGRLMDHISRGSINLNKIRFVVLDEADEMLDMGFREDIEFILDGTPETRQTVMFSATMPDDIKKLMNTYQKNPKTIDVTHHKLDSPKIEQFYFDIQSKAKPEALARLIDLYDIKLALVFCNTKYQVDNLVGILKSRGYFAEGLHGDMNQNQREKVMNGFRNGSVEILVATDVAGRGIDVNDVEAVFNYDLPRDDEDYIHRIGRTGRAGKSGIAFTFIVGKEIYSLKRIEKTNDIKVTRKNVPTLTELEETRINSFAEDIKAVISEGHISKFINLVEELMGEEYSAIDVAAALLKISMDSKKEGFDKTLKFEKEIEPEKSSGRKKSFGKKKPFRDKKSFGGKKSFGEKKSYGKSKSGGERRERSSGERRERSGGERRERSGGDRRERFGGRRADEKLFSAKPVKKKSYLDNVSIEKIFSEPTFGKNYKGGNSYKSSSYNEGVFGSRKKAPGRKRKSGNDFYSGGSGSKSRGKRRY